MSTILYLELWTILYGLFVSLPLIVFHKLDNALIYLEMSCPHYFVHDLVTGRKDQYIKRSYV